MESKPGIAYFLLRFPHLTETFILREMLLLRKLGFDVHVFSVIPPLKTSIMHKQVQEMMPYAHYSPFFFSVKLILAQFDYFFRAPIRYFRAFFKAIWQTLPEPGALFRAIVTFPKSVYFAKQLKELGIDHIHAHFVWTNGIAAQIAADLNNSTFSLHPHAWGLFMRPQESVKRQLETADKVITVSEYHRQYIANLCPNLTPEDIEIVHYGIDPQEFAPSQRRLTEDDEKINIISVGSLVEKKGHEYLVDACAELSKKGYNFHCNIVGGGAQDKLQERIRKHNLQPYLRLTGAKTQSEVKKLYAESDIFALPCVVAKNGDRDGMPNVLLEAMAQETPVITTPVTGIPELVEDGKTGLLIPERDADALAQGIERLINDQSLRSKLGQQGRQIVLIGFDIHQTASRLAKIFQKIIER